jgi:hypothetical protein
LAPWPHGATPSLTAESVRQPEEILKYLEERFERDYPDWARQRGSWPLRLTLRPPTSAERSEDPIACHTWAEQWNTYGGPGTVEYANLRFPTGTHRMPRALRLDRPADVAAAGPSSKQMWQRCGQRLVALQLKFPDARFTGMIRRIAELDPRDYDRLANTAAWLRDNPTSGMLLRQLPIEGIGTKWLASHARLVLALLGDVDFDPEVDAAEEPRRLRLHRRLGLRIPPDLVQVAVLDPHLREQVAGMRHFAASIDDLNRWQRKPGTVVILENKETGYALTGDYTNAVVLHGEGFSVLHYARIDWVREAGKIIYWGDIDAAGLQFVNDLRSYGIDIATVMMDIATLEQFRSLAVDGASPQRLRLPHLNETERNLYQALVAHATARGTGLLLEQERIPWTHAHLVLLAAMADGPK